MIALQRERLAVSPCSNPELSLERAIEAYALAGYVRMELFTSWVKSSVDWNRPASELLNVADRHNMKFSSLHLPPIIEHSERAIEQAVKAAQYAEQLGVRVVLFKAKSRELYIQTAKQFLDLLEKTNCKVTPVLQNHAGSPISTLDDYRQVIRGIADSRMKALLEVGHFHTVGVHWEQGIELLGDQIELVHIKDQTGSQSVGFGHGEINLKGLIARLESIGYRGEYVIEMEVADRMNTLRYLKDALAYVLAAFPGGD